MNAGFPAKSLTRAALAAVPVFLGMLLFSGCGPDHYPESMTYPVRSDPLLMEAPSDPAAQPKQFDLPGQLPLLMGQIKEKQGRILSPADLEPKQHDDLGAALTKVFGTPANPRVDGLEDEARKVLKLDPDVLARGSQLYRRHCLHCHGVPGDGRGPTAAWVNPHPRDYRKGIFKFTSTAGGTARKPRREDLIRTLKSGIEGTSMPTFDLLSIGERDALVSYVIHLSMRGEIEYETMKVVLEDNQARKTSEGGQTKPPMNIQEPFDEIVPAIFMRWQSSQSDVIKPDNYQELNDQPLQESVRRGHLIFKQDGCLGCHLNYGRKDNFLYDDWGTIVRAQNLTLGIYRGGRRPVDLYWRMHSGINGSKMPAVYDALSQQNPPKKLWDLVNFVLALPYPAMLPEDIRSEIYGTP